MKKAFALIGILLCTTVFFSFSQEPPGKGKFINFTEGGVLIGNSENQKKAPFIFHSSLNYVLYKNLSAGIGTGAEFLKETYLPLTANILYQFGNRKAVYPFVRFRAGYDIGLESTTYSENYIYYSYSSITSSYPSYPSQEKLKAEGGWMIDPSVGIIVYTRAGLGFTLSAGYRHQTLKYSGKNDYLFRAEYNRLMLALGVTF